MIVVSNTSPLTNLAAIGQFDLLQSLFTRIHIAQAVEDENTDDSISDESLLLQPTIRSTPNPL